jgi:hypothetical protein
VALGHCLAQVDASHTAIPIHYSRADVNTLGQRFQGKAILT